MTATEGLKQRLDRLESLVLGPRQPFGDELDHLSSVHWLYIETMLMTPEQLNGPEGEKLGERLDTLMRNLGVKQEDFPRIATEATEAVDRWVTAQRAWEANYGASEDGGVTW